MFRSEKGAANISIKGAEGGLVSPLCLALACAVDEHNHASDHGHNDQQQDNGNRADNYDVHL